MLSVDKETKKTSNIDIQKYSRRSFNIRNKNIFPLLYTCKICTVLFTYIWIRWVITYLIIKCPSWPGFLFLLIRSVSHFIKLSNDGKHDVDPIEDLKFIVFWSGIKSLICILMCLVSKQPFDTNSKAFFQLNIINNNIFTILVIFLSTSGDTSFWFFNFQQPT